MGQTTVKTTSTLLGQNSVCLQLSCSLKWKIDNSCCQSIFDCPCVKLNCSTVQAGPQSWLGAQQELGLDLWEEKGGNTRNEIRSILKNNFSCH